MRPWRAVAILVAALGLTGLATAGFAFHEARSRPILRRADIALSGWPPRAGPLRVALVSDIHLGNPAMDRRRLDAVVAQINSARPDLILVAGDFVAGHTPEGVEARTAGLVGPLSRLKAPLGVVAVLGNHDHWTSAETVRAALKRAGIRVLDNAAVRAGPIAIAGVGDDVTDHDRPEEAIAAARRLGGPIVVLAHSPAVAPRLPKDVALALTGHTHCGQIVLPLLTRWAFESHRRLYDPRYRCGLVRDPGHVVVVTAGVGTSVLPLRIGAPPDLWLLTLTADPPTAAITS